MIFVRYCEYLILGIVSGGDNDVIFKILIKSMFFQNIVIVVCFMFLNVQSLSATAISADKNKIHLHISVIDSLTRKSMSGALIAIYTPERMSYVVTDIKGEAKESFVQPCKIRLHLSFLGYKDKDIAFLLDKNKEIQIEMTSSPEELNEVVVTAQEMQQTTTTSKINKESLSLLQPSSLSDIFELLPGGYSKDPNMGGANLATLRTPTRNSGDGYSIETLGTGFVIDGVPMSNNMNMQSALGAWESKVLDKNTVGMGIDMRAISTDAIQSIEVMRGVASSVYGDMTNGLIKVNRNYGYTGLEARMKMDAKSKLFYLGKSFYTGKNNGILNLGIDYLDSRIDPRSSLESFKRIGISSRYRMSKQLNRGSVSLNSHFDYSSTIDNYKEDVDILNNAAESFKSQDQNIVASINLGFYELTSFMPKLNIQVSTTVGIDKLEKVDFVQIDRPTAVPNTDTEGEFEALVLPPRYTSEQRVEGRPVNIFTQLIGEFTNNKWSIDNELTVGGDIRYEKNFGRGYIYDLSTPPSPSVTTKPTPFKDIPAYTQLAFFAEETISLPLGKLFRLDIMAGLRAQSLLGIASDYTMKGKWYLDPRTNFGLHLPHFDINGKEFRSSLHYAYGLQTKMPVASHLYPDPFYYSYIQLNYFHENPENRLIHIRNYKIDPTNFDVEVSRNRKSEFRLDLSYDYNFLSVIYFNEYLSDGFRNTTPYNIFDYKKYSTTGQTIVGKPDLSTLPFTNESHIATYGVTTNGSTIDKEGVEFQLALKRFKFLNTRFTANGAWIKSLYHNSQALMKKASEVIGNEKIEYVGIYDDKGGRIISSFNTSFYLDSYIPRLGLNIILSAQCLWSSSSHDMWVSGIPTHYVGVDGVVKEFDVKNTIADHSYILIDTKAESLYQKWEDPKEIYFNIKLRKKIYKESSVSLFVNRAFAYLPEVEVNGVPQVRYTTPYFGAELNIKF